MKQLVLPPSSRSQGWVELKHREHHYQARVRRIAVGERLTALDDVGRQACEAGVSAIAKEAAQQSGSARVCDVRPPVPSRELVAVWDQPGPLLFFHQTPLNQGSLHRYLFPQPNAVGLVVGPEGGLAPEEVEVFLNHGAKPVWLGPSVLRAETASLYAVAAVNTILQETPEWTIPL